MCKIYFLLIIGMGFVLNSSAQGLDKFRVLQAVNQNVPVSDRSPTVFYFFDDTLADSTLSQIVEWKRRYPTDFTLIILFEQERSQLFSSLMNSVNGQLYFVNLNSTVTLQSEIVSVKEYLLQQKFNQSYQHYGEIKGMKILVNKEKVVKGIVAKEIDFSNPFFDKAIQISLK